MKKLFSLSFSTNTNNWNSTNWQNVLLHMTFKEFDFFCIKYSFHIRDLVCLLARLCVETMLLRGEYM